MYVDDVLVAEFGAELQAMLDVVAAYVARWKVKFNSRKTTLMVVGKRETGVSWKIGDEIVEERRVKGVLSHSPPKFEHIFVAVITFHPFLLCRYFYYQLVAYCACFKMICKKSL